MLIVLICSSHNLERLPYVGVLDLWDIIIHIVRGRMHSARLDRNIIIVLFSVLNLDLGIWVLGLRAWLLLIIHRLARACKLLQVVNVVVNEGEPRVRLLLVILLLLTPDVFDQAISRQGGVCEA